MIRYALSCDQDHGFEAWFGSSSDYDDQVVRGLIECPICLSKQVKKQMMAPAVSGTKKKGSAPEPIPADRQAMVMEAMGQLRKKVEDDFDYVGDAFADEARAIHEGRSEDRGIYGEASPREVKALVEDGIQVAPLPPAATPTPKAKLN